VKILLDSCAFIDLAVDAYSLTDIAKTSYQKHDIFFSVASVWELGLKKSIGKLDFDISKAVDLLPENGIRVVDITLPITLLVNELPYHHKDPFDRIIIATAKINKMTIMTSDTVFEDYGLDVIPSRIT